mmetsp:Transcript_14939/g.41159  ORF Transcript_14939/g.41159 Transcript_14939/m.41159 type:complete len:206 (-) Transcript_14939:178-795(-)
MQAQCLSLAVWLLKKHSEQRSKSSSKRLLYRSPTIGHAWHPSHTTKRWTSPRVVFVLAGSQHSTKVSLRTQTHCSLDWSLRAKQRSHKSKFSCLRLLYRWPIMGVASQPSQTKCRWTSARVCRRDSFDTTSSTLPATLVLAAAAPVPSQTTRIPKMPVVRSGFLSNGAAKLTASRSVSLESMRLSPSSVKYSSLCTTPGRAHTAC